MVSIRLSNRSQSRRIKNLQQQEGDKVWTKTVVWAHAFEKEAESHALEKETITSKAGRNSLILDFGKYEEGKVKYESMDLQSIHASPLPIQGTEKFEVTEAKVLELITREHEVKTLWDNLYLEMQSERSKLKDATENVKATKKKIGEEKYQSGGDSEGLMKDLKRYRSERSSAHQVLKSLGFATIQDQLDSEWPSSQVRLAKTSKLIDETY
jgi:hypothetical protein